MESRLMSHENLRASAINQLSMDAIGNQQIHIVAEGKAITERQSSARASGLGLGVLTARVRFSAIQHLASLDDSSIQTRARHDACAHRFASFTAEAWAIATMPDPRHGQLRARRNRQHEPWPVAIVGLQGARRFATGQDIQCVQEMRDVRTR